MKKLLVLSALIVLSGTVFSQTLQKGNLVGVHVYNINLKPDVTPNQMKDFIINKLIPAYESNPGANMYLTKCIRGENKYSYGLMVIFKSESERNKFYNEEGELTELGIALSEKMQPIYEEFTNTIGEFETEYNDWVVQ